MKKKLIFIGILVLACALGSGIHNAVNYKGIEDIAGFQRDNITEIYFQYDNPAIKGGVLKDKEKIKEFMNYICSCTFKKRYIQDPIDGYYQLAVFFRGNEEAMRIATYKDFIDINNVQYDMVRNKLNLNEIADFVKSAK